MLFLAVNDRQLFEQEDRHEPADERDHQMTDVDVLRVSDFSDLRNQIEKRDADEQPRRERHDVEEVLAIPERKRASGQSHDKCGEGVQRGHRAAS